MNSHKQVLLLWSKVNCSSLVWQVAMLIAREVAMACRIGVEVLMSAGFLFLSQVDCCIFLPTYNLFFFFFLGDTGRNCCWRS